MAEQANTKQPHSRVRVLFEPSDLWFGLYVDTDKRQLYVCLVPMFPLVIDWGRRQHIPVAQPLPTHTRCRRGGTLALSWGDYGGFYLNLHRICLGWVALTLIPKIQIEELMRAYAEKYEAAQS